MKSLTGKTILVTGATGFIGTHLVNRLRRDMEDIHFVLLARKTIPKSQAGEMWVYSLLNHLSSDVWRDAGVGKIDVIFHLGAFTPKTAADADRVDEVYDGNLLGTRFLLESLPSLPERIIFASTLDVYAPKMDGNPLDEDSRLGPISLYGASKLFCEQLIRVYAKRYGCGYAILRYGHIYGPGEEAYKKLIPEMIRRLLLGEKLVLYGDGSTERDFLYVTDAVEATLRAALSERTELGPVNVVRGESTSIRSIAESLIRITGFQEKIKYLKDKPSGYSLRFDNRLMHKILGEWNFVSLEEGLKYEVDYFRSLADEKR